MEATVVPPETLDPGDLEKGGGAGYVLPDVLRYLPTQG
jgi:hypothetical protein